MYERPSTQQAMLERIYDALYEEHTGLSARLAVVEHKQDLHLAEHASQRAQGWKIRLAVASSVLALAFEFIKHLFTLKW